MADKRIPSLDPFALWRDWIVKSEQQWSEGLTKFMKDDRVAEAMGKQLQQARFLQKMFGEMMQPYLAGMNLPSRSDVESIEERLGKEDGLAALQAAFVQLRTAIVEARAASPESAGGIPKVPRTRKPAAEGTSSSSGSFDTQELAMPTVSSKTCARSLPKHFKNSISAPKRSRR
jgi:hypothetical protein